VQLPSTSARVVPVLPSTPYRASQPLTSSLLRVICHPPPSLPWLAPWSTDALSWSTRSGSPLLHGSLGHSARRPRYCRPSSKHSLQLTEIRARAILHATPDYMPPIRFACAYVHRAFSYGFPSDPTVGPVTALCHSRLSSPSVGG